MATIVATGQPASRSERPTRTLLLALLLTLVLTAAWTVKDFAALSIGRLPDNDDMMRLAEIRDWIGGQGFSDLVQHRLGPGEGASMHWSRIADAGPALILLALTPILGTAAAELGMIVLWPALLFFLFLLLMARIAGRLIGAEAAPVALVVAALAFPTVSLFVPGRIDHHGLQIVLILVLIEALVSRPGMRAGLVAGGATALSLAVGLEAAPEIVAAMAAQFWLWARGDDGEDGRALGFAGGLGGVTTALLLLARPELWPREWCDGFTPASVSATLAAAACWGAVGLLGRRLRTVPVRIAAGAAVGAAGLGFVLGHSSVCFTGPYGALDPFLKRVWMDRVDEASSLFVQQNVGTVVAYGGLCVVGLIAGLARYAAVPSGRARWTGFILFLGLGVAAALMQIRVTYIMAAPAALPLVALILAARVRRSVPLLLLAWIGAAGFFYNYVGTRAGAAFSKPATAMRQAVTDCTAPAPLAAIAQLPPGLIVAPLDSGAYLVGMTPHRVMAAPYHRNNAGNLAMYRFFLAPPQRAAAMARAWGVDYVALCPSSFREIPLQEERPGSLAARLQRGLVPAWLARVPIDGDLQIYRVVQAGGGSFRG